MRKSPIKHRVRQHQRTVDDDRITVHDYVRGHGSAPVADPNSKHNTIPASFTVIVNYLDSAAKETLHVTADNYPSAIQQAMASRINTSTPTVVEALKQ